ncbi:hypothetical protein I6F33_30885 [Bradyrhizobium sp. BRP20]|uniref:hypothetical protein n=1 Tax=unclassified Bradyrhizobium TaxID=2631580 RepID=UPI001CD49DC6|nr:MULTISPECIES: hypothetical protein [unclassified Bradyrhizobium]MCA1437335.1 hypothetical protein [Bradyrhizobium sp. BRP20]MCA1551427.1 hypothetical protein [Bradyrhizobium sp. BRP19]
MNRISAPSAAPLKTAISGSAPLHSATGDRRLYPLATPRSGGAEPVLLHPLGLIFRSDILLTQLIMLSRSSGRTTLRLLMALAQRCPQSSAAALGCRDEWVSTGAGNIGCYSHTANVADAVA